MPEEKKEGRLEMGASTFEIFVEKTDGIKTAKEAFEKAVNDAIRLHGTEPYSGTIKEKDSFELLKKVPGLDKAQYLAYSLIDTDEVYDKWGPASCIEILNPIRAHKARTVKMKIESYKETNAIQAFYAKLADNEIIDTELHTVLKKKGRITHDVKNTEGPFKLRYVVKNILGDTIFDNKSDAIRFAKEFAKKRFEDFHSTTSVECRIEQKKVSDVINNGVIATVTSERGPNIYEVSAKVREVDLKDAEVTGWLFFGWASC